MQMEARIKKAETKQFKVIFPNTLNDHDTLFGGIAMQWLDEVAYITATRFSRKKMVTVSVDKIKFLHPLRSGTIAEIIGKINHVGSIKIDVKVEIFVEEMYEENRQKAIEALFVFAAIDDNHKPIRIEAEYTEFAK
jgi:acyl-CoA hydrolase